MPVVRNCAASIVRRANLTYSASVKLNFDGVAAMRSGGSVLKALSAAEGALPREHRPRAGRAEQCREHRPRAGRAELYREPAVQNLREHPLRAGQQTSCTSIRQHVRTR